MKLIDMGKWSRLLDIRLSQYLKAMTLLIAKNSTYQSFFCYLLLGSFTLQISAQMIKVDLTCGCNLQDITCIYFYMYW